MYSRKSLGQKMEPWGTPALTRYSIKITLTAILSDTTVRGSAVDRDLKYTRNQKKGHISLSDQ